jgi:purine catabolism regulator
MSITVRSLVSQSSMRLSLLSDDAEIDQPLTWVHVSELDDPTPFLSGGELLLTTGLTHRTEAGDALSWDGYLQRLSAAGVVGLGFGTGLSHDEVPAALVVAARRYGVPLIEVPRGTPFIAISRAVSSAIAAEEYAEVTRTFDAQMALTRGALTPSGTEDVVRLLAGQVGGWVLLVDSAGALISVHPSSARRRATDLSAEFSRLSRHRGPVSSSLSQESETVDLQPIGTGTRRVAYLAVGRNGPISPSQRHLVNAAVLLLTMRLQRPADEQQTEATLRTALLRLLLAGSVEVAQRLASQSGRPLPPEPFRVLVVPGWRGEAPTHAAGAWWAMFDDALVVIASQAAAGLGDRLAATADRTVGISAVAAYPSLDAAVRQASQAAAPGHRVGARVVHYEELASTGVIGLLDPALAHGFAEALLSGLIEHDRQRNSHLVLSLRTWLAHHGQWDPAAAALGVHRHTLRKRIVAAEGILGRDLGDPGNRSELWLALELIARRRTEEE